MVSVGAIVGSIFLAVIVVALVVSTAGLLYELFNQPQCRGADIPCLQELLAHTLRLLKSVVLFLVAVIAVAVAIIAAVLAGTPRQ